MEITRESSTVLKPSPHPLTGAVVPLTIFDRAAFDLFVPVIYAFRPPIPDNATLTAALRAALLHFPHLAGSFDRLEGRPCIVLDDSGVRVVEATSPTTLARHLPLRPSSPDLASLYPDPDEVPELFHVQLTRFACGGLALGITCHHRICDGQSVNMFFFQWSHLVRAGPGAGITIPPRHDRAAVVAPRSPPAPEFKHQLIEFKKDPAGDLPKPRGEAAAPAIANLVVNFPAEFIAKLKLKAAEESCGGRCTTFQTLLAHMWKKITAARGVPAGEFTQVRVAVNGRPRLRAPMEYFGNLVLWAHPRMKVENLLTSSYGEVVRVIQDSVAKIDDRYFRSFIDFGEVTEEELSATAPEPGSSLCPNLEVDSWLSFSFDELNMGGGKPCAFLPPNLPVEGLMLFVPANGGGVDVFLALMEEHVDAFNRISHSFN